MRCSSSDQNPLKLHRFQRVRKRRGGITEARSELIRVDREATQSRHLMRAGDLFNRRDLPNVDDREARVGSGRRGWEQASDTGRGAENTTITEIFTKAPFQSRPNRANLWTYKICMST